MPRRKAFTLVELLVVVAIIGVLLSLLLPALGRAREMARRAGCLSNLQKLSQAWVMYAQAHDGDLAGAEGLGARWDPPRPWDWVGAGNTDDDMKLGKLYQYVSDPEVFRCPHDANLQNVRTYSVNMYCNGEGISWGVPSVRRLSAIRRPTETFVFIEEFDPRGYNLGSWVINRHGDQWIDYPVSWHNVGCNLGFADGHAEYWKWTDPRTSQIRDFYQVTPNNPDLKRLQQVLGY